MDSDALDPSISPQDRDMMIRTVIGEAGNQPDIGRVAVAHTILNRLAAGTYGNSPSDVVLAPSQFEPWQSKPGKLMAYSPTDPAYQKAARAVDAALSGAAPDPTGGAVNFYSPSAQQSLGRPAPTWATGQGLQIGAHVFYGGGGKAGATPKSTGATMAQSKSSGMSDADIDALLSGTSRGGTVAAATPAGPAAVAPPAAASSGMSDDDIDALLSGQTASAASAAAPGDRPLTIRPQSASASSPGTTEAHPGMLAAAPGDGTMADIGKNIATGAIKGVGDAVGAVGNTGNLADYLLARGEGYATGQPPDAILADLAQQRAQQQQSPTIIGRLAAAIDPRQLLPSGAEVANKLLALTGSYEPTTPPGRMLQAGVETAVGSLGPGVRGTGASGPATAATVASPGAANALMQAAGSTPGAFVAGGVGQGATDATGDPLMGMAAGAAAGATLGAAGAAGNKLIGTVDPATAALAETARNRFNIPVGVGQISDSPAVRFASSVTGKLPLSGAAPAAAEQQTAFNRAVSNTFGADAPKVTPDVMQAAKTRLGNEFDRVAAGTTITNTQAMGGDLRAAMNDAMTVLPEAELKPLAAQVQNIVDVIKQNSGTIPGESYQALTRKGAPLDRAMSGANPNVAYYAGRIRDALDNALEASAPPGMADDLRTARLQYKNLKTIEPLAEKATTGDISPALLMGAVRNSYDGMAYGGGGDIGDLARIGQRFMKEPPSSGTSERLGMMNMLAQAGGGMASFMMGDPTPLAITAAGVPASLAVGRGVRSFLGSDGATNRLIAASLGRNQASGFGGRLLAATLPYDEASASRAAARR